MQKIGCLREVIEGLEVQLAESREQLEAQTLEVNRQQNRLQDLASFSLEVCSSCLFFLKSINTTHANAD